MYLFRQHFFHFKTPNSNYLCTSAQVFGTSAILCAHLAASCNLTGLYLAPYLMYCENIGTYLLESSKQFWVGCRPQHGVLDNGLSKRLGASRFAHKKEWYSEFNADCYHEDIFSKSSISGNVWTQSHAVQQYFLAAVRENGYKMSRPEFLHASLWGSEKCWFDMYRWTSFLNCAAPLGRSKGVIKFAVTPFS